MKKNQGFTLMELMITIAIFAILASIAIANLLASRPQRQLQSAARQLYADVQKGKLTAIKEYTNCVISITGSGTNQGYLIFTDAAKDATFTSGSDRVIASGNWSTYPYVSLSSSSPTFPLVFHSNGMVYGSSGGFSSGNINIQNTKGEHRVVTLSQAGNVRVTDS